MAKKKVTARESGIQLREKLDAPILNLIKLKQKGLINEPLTEREIATLQNLARLKSKVASIAAKKSGNEASRRRLIAKASKVLKGFGQAIVPGKGIRKKLNGKK